MLLKNEIVSRKLDGEEIILHLKTGTYFGLNQTGTFLFECCQKSSDLTEAELAQALTEEFDVDLTTATNDVKSFLKSMRENQLIAENVGA